MKMMIRFIKHLIFMCLPVFIISGTALSAENSPFYIDMGESFIVRPYVSMRQIFLNYEFEKTGQDVYYTTKPGLAAGLSIAWGKLGLSAGYDLPVRDDDFEGDKKGGGELDLRLDFYGRAMCFDFYYQHSQGFYLDNPEEVGIARSSDGSLPFYEDMGMNNISASLYYIFSSRKFSARAAFDGSDMQKESAGSFLLMSTAGMLSVKSGSSLMPQNPGADESELSDLDGCDYSHFSVSPGYGYISVFGSGFYLCEIVFIGPGLSYAHYSMGEKASGEMNFFLKPNVRIASGYSGKRFFCGLSVISEIYIFPSRMEMTGSLLLFEARFFAGCRFI